MTLHRSGLDLRHGPPAYESHLLPGMLSYNQDGEYYTTLCGGVADKMMYCFCCRGKVDGSPYTSLSFIVHRSCLETCLLTR